MGVIWYILGVGSGMLLLLVMSCSVVSGRISREEENREFQTREDNGEQNGRRTDGRVHQQGKT